MKSSLNGLARPGNLNWNSYKTTILASGALAGLALVWAG